MAPTAVVNIIQKPAKEAYVIPTGIDLITIDKQYIHAMIVIALNVEGIIFVNPLAELAKELDKVPKKTATNNAVYGKSNFIKISIGTTKSFIIY